MVLTATQPLEEVLEEGWAKVDETRPFPTFTTSRPRDRPGRKPAGVQQCTDEEILRWQQDQHRFPPYQYTSKNCVRNKHGDVRLPSVREKEFMLGFPVGCTAPCVAKSHRKGSSYVDCRHTLLGNTWSVPVVAWFLGQLFHLLGCGPARTPQEVVDNLRPDSHSLMQSRLFRAPVRPVRGHAEGGLEHTLTRKLCNLVSVKGEDILLSTPSSRWQNSTDFERLYRRRCGNGKWLVAGSGKEHGSTLTPSSSELF